MTSMAGLAFVLHLWLSLNTGRTTTGRWRLPLLASPYILFIAFSVTMVVIGSLNPETVSRSRALYCRIDLPLVKVIPGTTAIIMAAVVVFEVLIGFNLYRHRAFTKAHTNTSAAPLHLFIRFGVFSVYSLLAFVACIAFWASTGDTLRAIIQASLPTAAFLIFGVQGDILRAWGITAAARFISSPFRRQSPLDPSDSRTVPVLFSTSDSRPQDTLDNSHSEFIPKDTILTSYAEKNDYIINIH